MFVKTPGIAMRDPLLRTISGRQKEIRTLLRKVRRFESKPERTRLEEDQLRAAQTQITHLTYLNDVRRERAEVARRHRAFNRTWQPTPLSLWL